VIVFAEMHEHDLPEGDVVKIGYEAEDDMGQTMYAGIVSDWEKEDFIFAYEPTPEKVIDEARKKWSHWKTFRELEN
jgi:cation diffusion facilitator CzcD-associated flavoprotein CzcO